MTYHVYIELRNEGRLVKFRYKIICVFCLKIIDNTNTVWITDVENKRFNSELFLKTTYLPLSGDSSEIDKILGMSGFSLDGNKFGIFLNDSSLGYA